MTDKQKLFLDFISEFKKKYNYSPTVREIAKGLGLSSPSAVQSMINKLIQTGYLTKNTKVARSLSVVDYDNDKGIPIIGRIKAGLPVNAEENIEGYIPVREFIKNSNGGFFLIVDGNSMIDKGILPGDYVFIQSQKIISHGQIGAFRLNGEVTLKIFHRTDEGIFLTSANNEYKPIVVNEYDEFEVIGRYVMLMRLMESGYNIMPA